MADDLFNNLNPSLVYVQTFVRSVKSDASYCIIGIVLIAVSHVYGLCYSGSSGAQCNFVGIDYYSVLVDKEHNQFRVVRIYHVIRNLYR